MRLTLVQLSKNRPIMVDFKNCWEVTNFLNVWPQEVRIALNEGTQLKKYHIFRTMDLENRVPSNSNHYTLPKA